MMVNETDTRESLGRRIVHVSRISGEFLLRSGLVSNVYFDKYRFESNPALLKAIAVEMAALLPAGTERVIGLEMGGIPLATAISLETGINAGFCRKHRKEYGTRLQIEGGITSGEKVSIIEDVITTGGAAIEAIKALREDGCEILALLCVVDREAGGAEKFADLGVDYRPLYTISELDKLSEP